MELGPEIQGVIEDYWKAWAQNETFEKEEEYRKSGCSHMIELWIPELKMFIWFKANEEGHEAVSVFLLFILL